MVLLVVCSSHVAAVALARDETSSGLVTGFGGSGYPQPVGKEPRRPPPDWPGVVPWAHRARPLTSAPVRHLGRLAHCTRAARVGTRDLNMGFQTVILYIPRGLMVGSEVGGSSVHATPLLLPFILGIIKSRFLLIFFSKMVYDFILCSSIFLGIQWSIKTRVQILTVKNILENQWYDTSDTRSIKRDLYFKI
jgi:hypothetical protein